MSPWRPLSGLPAMVTGHYCTRMLRFRTRKSLSYTHKTASSPSLKHPLVCKQCVGKTRGESLTRRRDGGGDVTQMGNSPQSALAPEVRSVSWDAWPAAAWKQSLLTVCVVMSLDSGPLDSGPLDSGPWPAGLPASVRYSLLAFSTPLISLITRESHSLYDNLPSG